MSCHATWQSGPYCSSEDYYQLGLAITSLCINQVTDGNRSDENHLVAGINKLVTVTIATNGKLDNNEINTEIDTQKYTI